MADTPEGMAFLKKKVGPLPVGVWLILIAGGVGLGLILRSRAAASAAQDTADAQDPTTGEIVDQSTLPSEDPGYGPITGGGPPSVYGGGALRLDPGTLRIRVQYPPKKHHHNKGDHHGGGNDHKNHKGAHN